MPDNQDQSKPRHESGSSENVARLTVNQMSVLDELRKIGRTNALKYAGSIKNSSLHKEDCSKLARGDEFCVFGMGGLTYQVGYRISMSAGGVLKTFKALERKGLVIRETQFPEYQRPLYWWPVGLAAELVAELGLSDEAKS